MLPNGQFPIQNPAATSRRRIQYRQIGRSRWVLSGVVGSQIDDPKLKLYQQLDEMLHR